MVFDTGRLMVDGDLKEQCGYRFGNFRLYPAQRLLLCGDDKAEIGQTTLSFTIFLVENAGRQLTKRAIVAGTWHKTVVGESTFANHVTAFRTQFGEDALITINGQGYQCTLLVEPLREPPPELLPVRPASPHSLPIRAAIAFGREAELAQAATELGRHRVLSVVGPGGMGKTWLAVELGWRLAETFPGGVHLIDLAPIRDAAAIPIAMAKVLGVSLRGTRPPSDVVASSLRSRQKLLLILDSCEYVAEPVGALVEALRAIPQLSILVTSQLVLGLADEQVLRLGPLAPADAAALFVDHVRAGKGSFVLDGSNVAIVAEICRRLDFIPNALQLAAGRARKLDIESVRRALASDERFRMLNNGPHNAASRQQTLIATVDWSHGLLAESDQAVFRRLSAFAGGFSPEAAIAVAGSEGCDRWDMIDALDRLVDRSLLIFETGERPRYRLLETLRLYGARKLAEQAEADQIAARLVQYYIGVFDQADAAWETIPDAEWQRLYGIEIDNIRTALDWTLSERSRIALGVALFGGAGRLWHMLDLVPEGRRYCDELIQKIDRTVPAAYEARLHRRGALLWRHADRRKSAELVERSALLCREIGDWLDLASALALVGSQKLYLDQHVDAKASLDEAWHLLGASDRLKSQISILTDLGALALAMNNLEQARQHHVDALELARKMKDTFRESNVLISLGDLEFRLGAPHRAIECAREAISNIRAIGQKLNLPAALTNLAAYHLLSGQADRARPCATEALAILAEDGGHWLRLCLQGWALLAALENRYPEAAQLAGYVDADYRRAGEIREPIEQMVADRVSAICADNLTPSVANDFFADGATWTEEHAVEFTIRRIVSPAD
jgi:predicted ATPase/DNA-binding winged helix-turn-helix (wHTH) protein